MFLLIGLCGCKAEGDVLSSIENILSKSMEKEEYRINNHMNYYSYYLPSDMGEDPLDSDSVVIKYNDSKIIMNVNVNGIINARYYKDKYLKDDGFFVEDKLIYSKKGKYLSYDESEKDYVYKLYKYNSLYIIHLYTSDMNYYGTATYTDLEELSRQIMIIAKNTEVDTNAVTAKYSKIDVIDYQKKQINLFDTIMPVNGELGSMLIEGAVIGDGSNQVEEIENTEE